MSNPYLAALNKTEPSKKECTLDTFFKMLAGENITIIEGPFRTASADVKNRIMRIPSFTRSSKPVRILFGAHEVGHFLFTPQSLLHEVVSSSSLPKGLFPFVNIIEDVRIEKKIKSKFPGLVREFKAAYSEITKDGFFGDISKLKNFADRFNVYSKVGSVSGITFEGKDLAVYKYLQSITEESQVIPFAKFLYLYSKETSVEGDLDSFGDGNNQNQNSEVTWSDDLEVEIGDGEDDSDSAGVEINENGEITKIKINTNPSESSSSASEHNLPQNVINKINEKLKELSDKDFEKQQSVMSDKAGDEYKASKADKISNTFNKVSAPKFTTSIEKARVF